MNKQIDFTYLGGLNVYQNTLDFLQIAYSQAIDAVGACFGNKVIVSGLSISGGSIGNGFVVLNGELLPVLGGALLPYLYVENLQENEQFADGTSKTVYSTKRMRFTSVSSGNYPFSDFARMPFCTQNLNDGFVNIQNLFVKMLFGEQVILSGGIATLAGSNVTITAGTAFIGGITVAFPAYSGAFPVYLGNAGTWLSSAPGTPHIVYNHDTSQFYEDVLLRKTRRSGAVEIRTNNSELAYFDISTGLGKWRWQGWKICDLMQSRVPLGYDRRSSSGGDAAWDALYNVVGNQYGEKKHILAPNEFTHRHTVSGVGPNNDYSMLSDFEITGGVGGGLFRSNVNTSYAGNSSGTVDAHENRQPFTVILYIERI